MQYCVRILLILTIWFSDSIQALLLAKPNPTANLAYSATKKKKVAGLTISGSIYNDANGLTDGLVNGPLLLNSAYVCLVDPVSNIILTSRLVYGTAVYSFSDLTPNTTYKVVYFWQEVNVGTQQPSNNYSGTAFTGEGTAPGGDGTPDGMTLISLTDQDVSGVNFGIDFLPYAYRTKTSSINPGGTVQVKIPILTGTDTEDGFYNGVSGTNTIIINSLPTPATGILYYQGVPVKAGDLIHNYNPAQLTVDPADGLVTVNFTFSVVDAAGQASFREVGENVTINDGPAQLILDFVFPPPTISGRVFHDANGLTDNTVNGTPLNDDPPLHVVILNPNPGSLTYYSFTQVAKDGTYKITVDPNTTYRLWLYEGPIPSFALYGLSTIHPTGEHIGAGPGSDGTPDAGIQVTVGQTGDVSEVNFGVDYWPVTNSVTATVQPNPLGTARVQVPTLTGSDPEDGVYDGISGTNTILISKLFGTDFCTFYYDNIPVTEGQTIPNYNPAKLTVDPKDGNVIARFLYGHVDAAGLQSNTFAQMTMPFSDTVTQLDFGDAPAAYGTWLNESNGPRHVITNGLRIGNLIDAEPNGLLYDNGPLLDRSATGDDITGDDDEDGITSFPELHANQTGYVLSVTVTNTTGSDATLNGWIDFNRDQQFSTNERAQVVVPTGATSATLIWSSITWTGGGFGAVGPSFARFRLASAANEIVDTGGQANSGEVEDYALTIQTPLPALSAGASLPLANVGIVVSLTATGATTYQWQAPSGAQFTTSATSPSVSASLITAGVQTFTLVATIGDYSQTLLVSVTAVSGPDLSAIISLPDANFQAGDSKDFLIQLQEVNGETASGTIVITITAPAGYTVDFNNSLTSIDVAGGSNNPVAVQNSKWQISNNVGNHQLSLTINSGESVEANTTLNLGFSVTRTTANAGSTSNITINVADDGGGSYDVNRLNNVYARIISGL
ncbi:hypothetical protein GO755_34460 [Spirosoma sp. HMF4905]|uniref:GEVED domain-containing protein n=1 Tax=Spirosoma arboris TaxID=2682092 RepID=A0A7K1SMZ9_9BACT|nr:GEVED domain-containing protein [Spirosoma arboris]MVM35178.1 hypothetical protein [Spirosoma arboris]